MDIRDNEIVKYLTGDTGEKTVDKERIKEMAADPEWISGVFTSGLKYITEQKEDLSPRKLSEKFGYMIRSIDDISKHADKDQVSRSAAHSISRMDGDVLSLVLTENLKRVMDAGIFTQIVDQLDDEKFKKLAVKIRFLHEKAGAVGQSAWFPDHEALDLAFTHLMDSEKAKRLQDGIQEKYELDLALKKEHAVLLKTGLNSIMKGERHCFMDDRVMQNLPHTVAKLYQKGKSRTAELLIHRLCDGLTDDDPDIRDAAAGILATIHEEIRPLEGSALARLDPYLAKAEKAPPKADDGTQTPARDISGDLEIVDRHIQQNNGEAAVKFLFDRIVAYARDKQFSAAETLRDKLLEVDPMALSEIVKSGEIIEAEKSGAINADFLDIWTDLNEPLIPEEVNTLYYALDETTFEADHTLFEQGRFNTRLFFINGGELKLVYRQENRELLLKILCAGDIAGVDTFFEDTVCTTSLITLSTVKVGILHKTTLDQWRKESPALVSKLRDYCLKLESASDILKKMGVDRRSYRRTPLSGPASIQILSSRGGPVGKPFRGDLSDISAGGLSFYIKTGRAETARLLLGRKLYLQFSPGGKSNGPLIRKKGTVIGVKYQQQNDYSVHVKFDTLLADHQMAAIRDGHP